MNQRILTVIAIGALMFGTVPVLADSIGFDVDLSLEVGIPGWTPGLASPLWTVTDLYGCTTTLEFSVVNQCSPEYERIECEKMVCLEPDVQDPTGTAVVTTVFSDDCQICIDTPECCGAEAPVPNEFTETEASQCAITPSGSVDVLIDHAVTGVDDPTVDGDQRTQLQRTGSFTFDRGGAPPGPATLELLLDLQGFFIPTPDFPDFPKVSSQWSLSATSPQLGALFLASVIIGPGGVVIAGDIPETSFQETEDGLEAENVVLPFSVAVPAPLDSVTVFVTLTYEGRAAWDFDGSDVVDITEMELDPSLDEDRSGILDVTESLGGFLHVIGEAGIANAAGPSGDVVVVSNIGGTGLDGVSIHVDELGGVKADVFGLPSAPPGGSEVRSGFYTDYFSGLAALHMILDPDDDGDRIRMSFDFSELGDHELHFFVNSGNFYTDLDYLEFERADGSGDTPWPGSLTGFLVGDPPVPAFAVGPNGAWALTDQFGNRIVTGEPVLIVPSFASLPDFNPDGMVDFEISAKNVPGFGLAATTVEPISECPVPFVRGDHNGDNVVALADLIGLLQYLFQSGTPPHLLQAADVNGDGGLSLLDGLYGLMHLFGSGAPPPPPFPNPGCPE